jgi:uncharacterized protein (TIGR00269 family)
MDISQKVKQTLGKIKLTPPKGVPRNISKEMFTKGKKEKILVALSGGKDSAVTCYFLKNFGYNIEGFHINLGMGEYSNKCLKAVEKLCAQLEIKLNVYDIKKEMGSSMCYLRSKIQSQKNLKNCAICGVIKKWIMNKEARKLKADKIATGHNLDDETQTFLMNIFKGSIELSSNSGAISKNISDKKFVSRIKPLFYIPEEEVRKYSKKKKLPVIYEKCPCALDSYRIQVRKFVDTLSDKDKENIIKNFETLFKKLKKKKNTEINYCEICGEPARNKICKMCQLMS